MSGVSEIYPIDGVTIREVGLRDGLQLVKSWSDTQQKSQWVIEESKAKMRAVNSAWNQIQKLKSN